MLKFPQLLWERQSLITFNEFNQLGNHTFQGIRSNISKLFLKTISEFLIRNVSSKWNLKLREENWKILILSKETI